MYLMSAHDTIFTLIACLVAVFGFDGLLHQMMIHLRTHYGPTFEADKKYLALPRILGWFERTIYIWAFVTGVYAFIAVWLTMKTFGGVQIWNQRQPGKEAEGRAIYQRYLIGTLASLMAAVISYYIVFLWLGSIVK